MLSEEVATREAIVRVLEEAGIDAVFGMPGGNTGVIYNALYDHRDTIRAVLVREESRAGVMAEVYGRLTGKPGVALAQAAFMANVSMARDRGASVQFADVDSDRPQRQRAILAARSVSIGRRRIRLLGRASSCSPRLPSRRWWRTAVLTPSNARNWRSSMRSAASPDRWRCSTIVSRCAEKSDPRRGRPLYSLDPYLPAKAAARRSGRGARRPRDILAGGATPVIIAGNGMRISRAYQELVALAEALGAPVATTPGGKGTFAETHDFALGVCGNFGTPMANAEIGAADVVLAVGSKLASSSDFANENPKLLNPQRQTLIQIDIETKNASWVFPAAVSLIGDAKAALARTCSPH